MLAKTKTKIKKIGIFLGTLLLSCVLFMGAFLMHENANQELDNTQQYVGVIQHKGIMTYKTTSNGLFGRTLQNKAFYLKLQGLGQNLGVYNSDEDYDKLAHELQIGDTIKIYYNNTADTFQLYLQVFQIEKNSEIVLPKERFQKTERKGFYLAIFSGIFLLFGAFYGLRKI